MFNEWDWRCAAVQLMHSTDPSYDNRTIEQHPQNENPDGSTLESTAQRIGRPFGGGGAETQGWGHHQEDPDQGVHRKGPGNHWWNSPVAYSADCLRFRCLTHNCECMCEGGLEMYQTSQIFTENTKNLRLIKSIRLLNKLKHPKKPNMLWFLSD